MSSKKPMKLVLSLPKKSKQEVKCIIHNNNYKKETKSRAFTEKSAEKVKIARYVASLIILFYFLIYGFHDFILTALYFRFS